MEVVVRGAGGPHRLDLVTRDGGGGGGGAEGGWK